MIKHTYDMGVVGNCAFLALIGTDTAVRWLCWPRFDSSFVFGPLLDEQKGGEFSIKPAGSEFTSEQRYLTNTNVLRTTITTAEGSYCVTDFAPRFLQYERYYKPLMLIRKVEPLSGSPRVRVACRPVGQYGEQELTRRRSSNHIAFLGLEEEIRLTTNIPLTYVLDEEDFVLSETKYLVLTYGAPLEAALDSTAERFLTSTEGYWRQWVKSTSISNFHQTQVIRSALALKIHQYEDTGAIIAASTTSLPEAPGSTRNWDYRYCWMRDTYYTLTAFNNIGHFEEIERYFQYILNISTKVVGKYQPLYGIGGQAKLTETELPLAGYLGNQPVRIGNDAYTHVQNDVYGQVLVALLPLYVDCRFRDPERTAPLSLVEECLRLIETTMDQPDAGLWEFRHIAQRHCYTYLFHWAGSHAARQVARQHGDAPLEALATRLLHEAESRIEQCFDQERGAYTNAVGSTDFDASTIQLITMGYLDPASEKAKHHLVELEKELKTPEGLFYRYRHEDDFGTPETTFLICSFWYVEALACVGRLDEAIAEFEQLVTYTNHLGLLSEDVDAKTGSQWGNFPQAYSHVGLVNAAYRIAKKLDKPNFVS
ncbi:MAG: glycoside hydrolase family 15 protein [Hymenobacter sp.]|nr:MAG: glycoside hydrolase family 15 protein [Hymenobacter sp.]